MTTGPLARNSRVYSTQPLPSPQCPDLGGHLSLGRHWLRVCRSLRRPGAALGWRRWPVHLGMPGLAQALAHCRCQEADVGTRRGRAVFGSRPLPVERQAPPAVLALRPELSSRSGCAGSRGCWCAGACVAWAMRARGIQSGEHHTALKLQRAVPSQASQCRGQGLGQPAGARRPGPATEDNPQVSSCTCRRWGTDDEVPARNTNTR